MTAATVDQDQTGLSPTTCVSYGASATACEGDASERIASPILFVGERRSPRAMAMGVDWTHGRLSAKTLHDALRAIGIDPSEQLYVNLFRDPPSPLQVEPKALEKLTLHCLGGRPVIALGKKVAAFLERFGIHHVALVHPAARGSIRRTENYQAHVAVMLSSANALVGGTINKPDCRARDERVAISGPDRKRVVKAS
jgi:hypothetical protein